MYSILENPSSSWRNRSSVLPAGTIANAGAAASDELRIETKAYLPVPGAVADSAYGGLTQLCENCRATPRMSFTTLIAPSGDARSQTLGPICNPRSKAGW